MARDLVRRLRGRATSEETASSDAAAPADDHALLAASPLFDHTWWALVAGVEQVGRDEAVARYLREGGEPHPLFDRRLALTRPWVRPGVDPLVTYLRRRLWPARVHPLLDSPDYLAREPDAAQHPAGPLGHYVEVGAARGARPNDWYDPDPAADPRGLVDWLSARVTAWHDERRQQRPVWSPAPRPEQSVATADAAGLGLVSVLLLHEVGPGSEEAMRRTLEDVRAQGARVEVVVAATHRPAAGRPQASYGDLVDAGDDHRDAATAWGAALAASSGQWVCFARAGDRWDPDRLPRLAAVAAAAGAAGWLHDLVERSHGDRYLTGTLLPARILGGAAVEPGCLLLPGAAARARRWRGELGEAAATDLLLGVAGGQDPVVVPAYGARLAGRTPPPARPDPTVLPLEGSGAAGEAALAPHLVDDRAASRGPATAGLTTLVLPAADDPTLTRGCVEAALREADPALPVEVVVVDRGFGPTHTTVLNALVEQHGDVVRPVGGEVPRSAALASALGVGEARGDVVVLLDRVEHLERGWLAPLRAALADPRTLAAGPLLLGRDGTVHAAGLGASACWAVPHEVLRGHPREDAAALLDVPAALLDLPGLALRRGDAVALHGPAPLVGELAGADLCRRLAARRPGRFVLVGAAAVVAPGRQDEQARLRFARRWPTPSAAELAATTEAWAATGWAVVRVRPTGPGGDNRLRTPGPVVRPARAQVGERPPRLRWALKNPALAGPVGDRWGDTAYAAALARALRELGQEVVVDRREAFDRGTGVHDDVVLALRGRFAHTPVPGQVNLQWVISHPARLDDADGVGWDHVFVASTPFAATLGARWDVPVTALHQATDPGLFHPDRAVPDSGPALLFLGSARGERRRMVGDALDQGLPLTLVGDGWEGLVPTAARHGGFVPNEEVGALYRAAGIVLNDHWEDMRELGFLSNRLFDALAAGARVVSDRAAGIEAVLGDAVQVVDGPEELAAVVRDPDREARFGDDAARRERAARVAAEHGFDARARVLLEAAVPVWRERQR